MQDNNFECWVRQWPVEEVVAGLAVADVMRQHLVGARSTACPVTIDILQRETMWALKN